MRGKLKERDAEIDALEEELVQAMEMGALEVELLGQESVWWKKYFENEVARREQTIDHLQRNLKSLQNKVMELKDLDWSKEL